MRRLVAGTRIHLPDGRRMTVQRILTLDGIRCVWWGENGHAEGTLPPAISRKAAPAHEVSPTANGHST